MSSASSQRPSADLKLPAAVAAAFESYPAAPRKRLLQLRKLLLNTAVQLDGVGAVEECLRWGQPTYLTTASGSGSMLRLHWSAQDPRHVALYVHCQTRLISEFKARYPEFTYEGKRGLLVPLAGRLPRKELADCMALALTYRLR